MQAISHALNRLLEDAAWFVRAQELELLSVRVAPDLRKTALQILAGLEFHADNRNAWVVFEDASLSSDSGWQARANRLLANWEARRDAFRQNERIEMPAASPPPSSEGAQAVTEPFRAALSAVLGAMQPPLEGLVIVLAPAQVEDAESFGRELEALLADPELRRCRSRCRWVCVLEPTAPAPSLVDALGARALSSECIADPAQSDADLSALIHSPAAAFGRAAPRGVAPPKRIDDPPPVAPEVLAARLRQAGIDPAYFEKAPDLRRLLFGAALAMKDGRGHEAVHLQREARDLAESLHLTEVAITCQIALATYLCGLGERPLAVEQLELAVKSAVEHALGLQQAQARLALALLHSLEDRLPDAAREYLACASAAENANIPLIAIEAYRMAGQLALRVQAEQQAEACFARAIRVAEGAERDTVRASSAAEAARQLATLCQEHGMRAQAESLFSEADAMERGEIGVTPISADAQAPASAGAAGN